MAEPSVISNIDSAIGDFFSQWNWASTVLVGLLLIVLIYPMLVGKEPDTHPFLLSRQSTASSIRYEGESAVFRSSEIPYGYPLRSGLAIKDPGASKWTSGRDGDIRDIWRQAVTGPKKDDGTVIGSPAKIITILGTEKIIEHDLKSLTTNINVIGKHIHDAGGRRVAVCLSNSVELLCTIFAGSFYTFSPILIPFSQTPPETTPLLTAIEYDTLIAEAGSVALEHVLAKKTSIRRIIWVAKAGNRHLDWNEVPEGVGGKVDVTTWHDLLDEKKASSSEVPPLDPDNEPMPIYVMSPSKGHKHEITEYSSKNLMAATAALQASLPRLHKLNSSDSILPATSLTSTYTLAWTFLTLFSGSTLLLNSVSGHGVNLVAATKSAHEKLKPTVLIAHTATISRFAGQLGELFGSSGLGAKYTSWSNSRLIQQDTMVGTQKPSYLPSAFAQLKTLYIEQPASTAATARITSATLSSLRLLLGARVSLALTAGEVAGAVAQSNVLDYRDKGEVCCVGPPVGSLEVNLAGQESEMEKVLGAVGNLVVRGPAAVGNVEKKEKVNLYGVQAKIDVDGTILLM